ncbi:prophage tail fiber N-terminal domain-containing protein [Citrobacter braakii]|uniref:prophage tail fiber N-terminal domain-containing protein n=1 Tax=Citrobacter braakii TaxID=57706 RepID=UPI002B24A310|nr:prophage tail fiber N-terminal domain-containing protein [Citrobacter braakii]MEB0964951.1 prophage tail fiber N-terminal domain-containing protein [Citrobacter braakii]
MSVLISGVLIDGAGIPMAECQIQLTSLANTSEVIVETLAVIETDADGNYSFEAQKGKYAVHIKQKRGPVYCVGNIIVYDDSNPGTLNDFLTALNEGDLKPDVVKRFEELVAQAQQSAKSSAESAQKAGKHAADAEQLKKDTETLAEEVRKNAKQTAQDREETALNAQASEKSAQDARGYRDSAQQIVEGLNASHATTTQKGLVQLSSATDSDSEELAATPKAVKTVMDEVQTRAPLDSPALTGGPTAPTPDLNAKGREIANAAFVRALIAALVGSVPETLDTLNELAAALDNDPHFATTMANALAGKQPLSEILTSLSGLMTAGNKLAYFSDKNVMALANLTAVGRVLIGQNSKAGVLEYLGLKSAAMMEPQADIRDRTEGRLAIPGAFGFGHMFLPNESIRFYSVNDLLAWVKQATPGEYFVEGSNGVLPGGYCGVINIRYLEANRNPPEPQYMAKAIILYTINGGIYYNRYWTSGNGYLIGWEDLKIDSDLVFRAINSKAPLHNPVFTGTPKTPTPPDNATGTEIATAAFVRKLLAGLVGSSPEALDTLNELAAALGNDPNFATTVTNALAGKQPLNAVLTALSNLTQRADTLPYFNADEDVSLAPLSEKARSLLAQETPEDMRTVLELKSTAMKEVQSDIYDRTEGRVALPGAFGYGSIFTSSQSFSSVDGPSEFLSWVTETPPGKYSVYQSGGTNYNPILNIDGKKINFSGVVEIVIPDFLSINENQTEKDKLVTFYGVNGEIYTNRLYAGAFCGWENLKLEIKDVINALRTTTGNLWGSPGVGGLIIAAYCGESDDDNNRKLIRGNIVPGSRLGMITLSGSYSTTGTYVSTPRLFVVTPNIYPQAGTFIALSGNTANTGDKTTALVGLFVRIA